MNASLTLVQGTYILSPGSKDPQAMQGAVVRVARPFNQEDRMVKSTFILIYSMAAP